MDPIRVTIGVFAHNEAGSVGTTITDLGAQTLMTDPGIDARCIVLCNGCVDDTAGAARAAVAALGPGVRERFSVAELAEKGKSRTWNVFTHGEDCARSDVIVYADADIRIPATTTLHHIVTQLVRRDALRAYVSRPLKDTQFDGTGTGLVGRLISAGGGMLDDYRKAITGQLYATRGRDVRRISMPVGLPVEDGYIREMLLTRLLTEAPDLDAIDGSDEAFHVYESIRTIRELIRHQTRIVIGSAINWTVFDALREQRLDEERMSRHLRAVAGDGQWLQRVIDERLPRAPAGYVPFEFLIKRVKALRRPDIRWTPKKVVMLVAGLGLDATVYVIASWKMFRRTGAGHW